MLSSIPFPLIANVVALCIFFANAQQSDPSLVGTWTTKSRQVVTGPGFYNPVDDKFIEPSLPGISYSFTADGWYEEAYYRAVSNPTQPACPSAVMQWQHGRYTLPGNGSILLEPIGVDGRQLTSRPCSYDTSLYVRYKQPELFLKYAVSTDKFHNVKRLDLYQFNGAPMHPMFLVATPPQMLPTQTLNPTAQSTGATATHAPRLRREIEKEHIMGTVRIAIPEDAEEEEVDLKHAGRLFWAGVAMVSVGTVMYLIPTSS